jgi:hypothetical protein
MVEGGRTAPAGFAEDFCRTTNCPHCGADVFFIRHNGGSVWVDELGWPWPKHGCFDEGESSRGVPAFPAPDGEPASELLLGLVEWALMDSTTTTQLLVRRYDEHKHRLVTVKGDHLALVGDLVGFSRQHQILTSARPGHEFVRILSNEKLPQ